MKRNSLIILTTVLLWILPNAAWLDAAPATAAGETYYTGEKIYQSRPDPARDTPFGGIGATGLMARIYPGMIVKIEGMRPGSPAEGKFSKGEIITGINGHAIHEYGWWKSTPFYQSIDLGPGQIKYLKTGTNVLAAYGNVEYDKKDQASLGQMDLCIEGLKKSDLK